RGHVQVLVATDVAARGIHIDDVAVVVHWNPVDDPKDYVHRSGRTARAGASGTVVSLVGPDDGIKVRALRRALDLDEQRSGHVVERAVTTRRDNGPSHRARGRRRPR